MVRKRCHFIKSLFFITPRNHYNQFLTQVVDMRWGVRDEATDDHMTTELCMKEIQNCQRLSMGPNFVVRILIFFTNH